MTQVKLSFLTDSGRIARANAVQKVENLDLLSRIRDLLAARSANVPAVPADTYENVFNRIRAAQNVPQRGVSAKPKTSRQQILGDLTDPAQWDAMRKAALASSTTGRITLNQPFASQRKAANAFRTLPQVKTAMPLNVGMQRRRRR